MSSTIVHRTGALHIPSMTVVLAAILVMIAALLVVYCVGQLSAASTLPSAPSTSLPPGSGVVLPMVGDDLVRHALLTRMSGAAP